MLLNFDPYPHAAHYCWLYLQDSTIDACINCVKHTDSHVFRGYKMLQTLIKHEGHQGLKVGSETKPSHQQLVAQRYWVFISSTRPCQCPPRSISPVNTLPSIGLHSHDVPTMVPLLIEKSPIDMCSYM